MGFLKKQQVKMAMRLLAWQYEKNDTPVPETHHLKTQAMHLVDDAHRIARERGGNVLSILKQMVTEAIRR